MKKLYLLCIISILSKTVSSQVYHPMLDSINHWQDVQNNIVFRLQQPAAANQPCNYPFFFTYLLEEYTTTDTTINSNLYKKVEALSDGNPASCTYGYIREDTTLKRVFFVDNAFNPEILLYDFSMQIGDSIDLQFQYNSYFYSGYYRLDSIRPVHIPAGFRNMFYLNNHSYPWSSTMPWLESVGCLYDVLYPFYNNAGGDYTFPNCTLFPHTASEFMTCFDHASKVYYDSCAYHEALNDVCFFVQDTCNYYDVCGAVHEISALSSMTIFPNPSSGKTILSLEIKHSDNFEILIRDISGKKTLKEISLGKLDEGKKDIELDLSSFTAGFYLVELKTSSGSVYRKLLIEK